MEIFFWSKLLTVLIHVRIITSVNTIILMYGILCTLIPVITQQLYVPSFLISKYLCNCSFHTLDLSKIVGYWAEGQSYFCEYRCISKVCCSFHGMKAQNLDSLETEIRLLLAVPQLIGCIRLSMSYIKIDMIEELFFIRFYRFCGSHLRDNIIHFAVF